MGFWIVGAGGVGREALDTCAAAGIEVTGFLDDRDLDLVRGLPVQRLEDAVCAEDEYIVAIADPEVRERIAPALDARGWTARSLAHPRSTLAPESTVGHGTLLQANAYVSSSVWIGRHCQIHYNATVGHDAVLADHVTVYPGANVSGNVRLERAVTIGSNAVVLQGRTVGHRAFVGAGAVVTKDVAPGAVVVGSPARSL